MADTPEDCLTNCPDAETVPLDLTALRREVERLSALLGALPERVAADPPPGRLAEAAGAAQHHLAAAGASVAVQVARHPQAASLIAFGLGLVAGIVTRPGRR